MGGLSPPSSKSGGAKAPPAPLVSPPLTGAEIGFKKWGVQKLCLLWSSHPPWLLGIGKIDSILYVGFPLPIHLLLLGIRRINSILCVCFPLYSFCRFKSGRLDTILPVSFCLCFCRLASAHCIVYCGRSGQYVCRKRLSTWDLPLLLVAEVRSGAGSQAALLEIMLRMPYLHRTPGQTGPSWLSLVTDPGTCVW